MTGKKFSLNLVLNVVIKLGAVAVGVLTARWANTALSETDLFEYNAILSYTTVLLTMLTFGFPTILQKFYTNTVDIVQRHQTWTAVMLLRIATFFLGLIVIFFTYKISRSENLALVSSFFCIQFIMVVDGHYRPICDAEGRSWQYSISDFLAKSTSVVLLYIGLLSFNQEASIWYLLGCLGIGYLISLVTDAVWQYKDTKFVKPDFGILKVQIKPIILLSAATVLYAAYNYTDKLFIANSNLPPSDLNSYVNGYKIFESALIVPGITIPMIVSFMKRRFDDKKMGFIAHFVSSKNSIFSFNKAFFTEWFVFSGLIGLILSFGILVFGPVLLWLIDPQNLYPKAYNLLPVFAISLFIYPILITVAQFIVFMKNGEKYELIGSFLVAIVALSSYTILIPRFGIMGAAFATVTYLIFDLFLKLYLLRKILIEEKMDNLLNLI